MDKFLRFFSSKPNI